MMKVHVSWAGAVLAIATLVLAACCGPTCSQQTNTSLGTIGTGQVFIVTNHSVYAPGEAIQATITNHLQQAIVVNNDNFTAYCPYFELQMRVGNDWQDMLACQTSSGDAIPRNEPQRIAAGSSFSSFVSLHADLPAGTYRLRIASGGYIVTDARGGPVGSGGTAESATFQICACSVACA